LVLESFPRGFCFLFRILYMQIFIPYSILEARQ
jgi:hypothetical protein